MTCGRIFCFHGAFKDKAKAKSKERSIVDAFIKKVTIRGKKKYAVVTRK